MDPEQEITRGMEIPTETAELESLVSDYQKKMKAAASKYEEDFIKRADRTVNYYELNHYYDEINGKKGLDKKNKDRVKVPYPYSNSRQILAEVYSGLPPVVVKTEKRYIDMGDGQKMDAAKYVQTMKEAIMYSARKSNLEREFKMVVLQGISAGVGCIQMMAQRKSNIPRFRSVMYREILWAFADVLDVYQSPWVAGKVVKPIEDVRNNPNYKEDVRMKVPAGKVDKEIYGELSDSYAVLWEVFDKKNNLFLVFADGVLMEPLQIERLTDLFDLKSDNDDFETDWPFSFFINGEMITSSAGLGDVYPIESLVKELDKTRTQMVLHRKRFNRKYAVRKGVLNGGSMNQLKSGEDGSIIEVDITPGESAQSAIVPVIDAPMSSDVYNVDKTIQQDIQITGPLGPNSLVRGVGSGPDTLGEAQIIEQSSNTRLADEQRQIAGMLKRVYKQIAEYIAQYWVQEDYIRVAGDGSNEEDWLKWDPTAAKGEYDFDVLPESLRDNTAVYRKQVADALAVVTPLLPAAQQNQGINIMVRTYLETFDTLRPQVDSICPAYQAPEQQMGGEPNVDDELLNMVQSMSEDELLAYLDRLPDNERQVLEAKLQELSQTVTVAPSAPIAPGTATPTQQSINQSVTA